MWWSVHIGNEKYSSHFIEESCKYLIIFEPMIKLIICIEINYLNFLIDSKLFGYVIISEFILI